MDDATAYMALVLNNAQGELSPLEIGMHALHSGMSGSEYARQVRMPQGTLKDRICAAKVADVVSGYPLADIPWQSLAAVHAAPRWIWHALVAAGVSSEGWTVEAARRAAQAVKGNQHAANKAKGKGDVASDNLSFATATSTATGKDKRTIERAARRHKALGDDLAAVQGTSLDKGSELDALAKMRADELRKLIQMQRWAKMRLFASKQFVVRLLRQVTKTDALPRFEFKHSAK